MESRNLPLLFSLSPRMCGQNSSDFWRGGGRGRKWDTWVNGRGRCFWCIKAAKHWDEQRGTGLPLKWENRCINQVLRSFKAKDEGERDERTRQACCGQSSKSAHWKQSVASCLGLWRGHVSYFKLFMLKYVWSDLLYLATFPSQHRCLTKVII